MTIRDGADKNHPRGGGGDRQSDNISLPWVNDGGLRVPIQTVTNEKKKVGKSNDTFKCISFLQCLNQEGCRMKPLAKSSLSTLVSSEVCPNL